MKISCRLNSHLSTLYVQIFENQGVLRIEPFNPFEYLMINTRKFSNTKILLTLYKPCVHIQFINVVKAKNPKLPESANLQHLHRWFLFIHAHA